MQICHADHMRCDYSIRMLLRRWILSRVYIGFYEEDLKVEVKVRNHGSLHISNVVGQGREHLNLMVKSDCKGGNVCLAIMGQWLFRIQDSNMNSSKTFPFWFTFRHIFSFLFSQSLSHCACWNQVPYSLCGHFPLLHTGTVTNTCPAHRTFTGQPGRRGIAAMFLVGEASSHDAEPVRMATTAQAVVRYVTHEAASSIIRRTFWLFNTEELLWNHLVWWSLTGDEIGTSNMTKSPGYIYARALELLPRPI